MISLEVIGWVFTGFLAVFALAMLAYVLLDEINYDYERWQ